MKRTGRWCDACVNILPGSGASPRKEGWVMEAIWALPFGWITTSPALGLLDPKHSQRGSAPLYFSHFW